MATLRSKLLSLATDTLCGPRISFWYKFQKPPYGGGNQFLLALRKELWKNGYFVGCCQMSHATKGCLLNSFNFDFQKVRTLRKVFPSVRMVHRVDGPVDSYRNESTSIDRKIWEINQQVADITIFQSQYSLTAHKGRGLDFINPVVVPNSVDGSIFHMRGRIKYPNSMRKVRLIANSWSDNPMKGGDVYKWLEEHLDWDRYEFTFVGHTREQFTRLSHLPACASGALASILRQHDIYLTASRNDPCSNSLLEALACGLPAVYLDSGGHKEIVGNAGIGFLRREEIPAALDNLLRNYLHFQQAIRLPEFSLIAKRYLNVLLTVK